MAFVYDLTDTWNAGGTTFNAIKMNVTDTASAAASKLITVQVGGSEKFSVRKDGLTYVAGSLGVGTSSPSRTLSVYDATIPIIALQNSTTGQTTGDGFQIYALGATAYIDQKENGSLNFLTNATERMRITSAGLVGIGTSSPDKAISVVRNQAADTGVEVSNLGTAGANTTASFIVSETPGTPLGWLRRYRDGTARTDIGFNNHLTFSGNIGTTPVERMRIDSSGRVGVGTSSPGNLLEVAGATPIVEINATSGSPELQFSDGGVDEFSIQYDTGVKALKFVEGGVGTHVTIKDGGNVGIGTSSPSDKLNISSSSNQIGLDTGDQATYGTLDLGHFTNGAFIGTQAGSNSASNLLRFGTSGTERMRIDSSGRVGIGTTSPSRLLELKSTVPVIRLTDSDATNTPRAEIGAASGNLTFAADQGNSGTGGNLIFYTGATAERMRIDSSGNLLVGTTSADGDGLSIKPRASGSATTTQLYFDRADTATQGNVLSFNNNGTNVGIISHTNTATTYSTSSDARLKENIADADDAATLIDALRVRKFDWKVDGSHQRYGMVAQELLEVAPEAVTGDSEGEDMMGVDYSKLVPMLIKEVQSLRARVAQLEGN